MFLLALAGVVWVVYKVEEERAADKTATKGAFVGAECLPCQARKRARQATVAGMVARRIDEEEHISRRPCRNCG